MNGQAGKVRVAVVFGGRSAEHAISCVSAGSVMAALDPERYEGWVAAMPGGPLWGQAEAAGYYFRTETIEGTTRAGYYPGAEPIAVKLLSDSGSGRLLGGQVVGGPGAGKRIDVLATAIWAGLTAEELAGSDLSYAPPFSPVYDPVVVAARVASRVEQG